MQGSSKRNGRRLKRVAAAIGIAWCAILISAAGAASSGNEQLHSSPANSTTPLDNSQPAQADIATTTLSQAALTRQREFRRELGLIATEEYVRDINASPQTFKAVRSSTTYGLTVTPAEAQELRLRTRIQDSLDELESMARRKYGSSFAGVYTDQARGGIVRVGFTSKVAEKTAEVARTLPEPGRIRGFQARYTYAQLRSTATKVARTARNLESLGITVTHASVEIAKNRVEIGVQVKTNETVAKLESRFGANQISVVKGKLSTLTPYDSGRDQTIRDIRGGLGIRWDRTGAGGFCSTAFMARDANYRYILTAGHCNNTGGTERFQGRHPDGIYRSIGHRAANLFGPGNRVDAQAVRLNSNIVWRDDVYLYPSRTLIDVSSWQQSAEHDHPGDLVCQAGVMTPGNSNTNNCGRLTRKDFAPSYATPTGNVMLAPTMRCATYVAIPGDSGAAVYRETPSGIHALGIQSGIGCGTAGDETIYSHIGNAMVDLGGLQIVT